VPFTGQVLDSLPPDVRAVTDADVAKVQEEARALVRAQALARTRSTSLSGRSVSDFIRVNRVEGLAIGGGITRRLGEGFAIGIRGRYGLADEEGKLRGELSYRRASGAGIWIAGFRDTRDASEVAERSGAVNSIAAQEFGSDYTDLYGVRGASVTVRFPLSAGVMASLEGVYERQRMLEVNATPANGVYEPPAAVTAGLERQLTLVLDRATRVGLFGFETQLHAEASLIRADRDSLADVTFGRFAVSANLEQSVGRQRIVMRALDVASTRGERLPDQHYIYMGGPVTGPGYNFHQIGGDAGGSHRVEIQTPVPFIPIRLGRYGRTPASITLAPYANLIWVNGNTPQDRWNVEWYPSVGVGLLSIFDLLRIDVARGFNNGRWTFSVDVARDLWRIL
jgi:hypothetical protein